MRAALLLSCPDRPGIVAEVGAFVAAGGGNIVEADQHSDPVADLFLQRIEFDVEASTAELHDAFVPVATKFSMRWELHDRARRSRVALLASRQGHCVGDILVRASLDELPIDVAVVVANHEDVAELTTRFGIPFRHLPVDDDRHAQEQRLARVLDETAPDLVVLARYMLVLPDFIVDRYEQRMINIHHSFLPSFAGARPYAQAHDRGVKVIGATAHYATAELDEGPIIAQRARDSLSTSARVGR